MRIGRWVRGFVVLTILSLAGGSAPGRAQGSIDWKELIRSGKRATKEKFLGKDKAQLEGQVDEAQWDMLETLGYMTFATDLGVEAAQHVIDLYPEERIGTIRQLVLQYNESKGSRSSGYIDGESMDLATRIAEETARLEGDWQGYRRDRLKNLGLAKGKLSLVVVGDTLALKQIPNLSQYVRGMFSGRGAGSAQQQSYAVQDYFKHCKLIAQQLPPQLSAFRQVRRLTETIAAAEGIRLPSDPVAEQVADLGKLQESVRALPDAGFM